jgi:hypothetical protein
MYLFASGDCQFAIHDLEAARVNSGWDCEQPFDLLELLCNINLAIATAYDLTPTRTLAVEIDRAPWLLNDPREQPLVEFLQDLEAERCSFSHCGLPVFLGTFSDARDQDIHHNLCLAEHQIIEFRSQKE